MEGCFNNGHELSGIKVNRLWDGVSFVMQARAARAATWGCAEVADACCTQYEALPPYGRLSRRLRLHCRRNGLQREHGVPQYLRAFRLHVRCQRRLPWQPPPQLRVPPAPPHHLRQLPRVDRRRGPDPRLLEW